GTPPPAATATGSSGSGGASIARKIITCRTAGADRVATDVAVSQAEFPDPGSARGVVLGRDDLFADALAGGPLAAKVHGPLLLTDPAALPAATRAEIMRVLPSGGNVYILGGVSAVS